MAWLPTRRRCSATFRRCRREITSLSALIGDLFELSRARRGGPPPADRGQSSPGLDLRHAREPPSAGDAQRAEPLGKVDAALAPVLMDPAQVQRVLYNLAQNAIRHTPSDGTVCPRGARRGRRGRGQRRGQRGGDPASEHWRASSTASIAATRRELAGQRRRGARPDHRTRHRGGPRRQDLGRVGASQGSRFTFTLPKAAAR